MLQRQDLLHKAGDNLLLLLTATGNLRRQRVNRGLKRMVLLSGTAERSALFLCGIDVCSVPSVRPVAPVSEDSVIRTEAGIKRLAMAGMEQNFRRQN